MPDTVHGINVKIIQQETASQQVVGGGGIAAMENQQRLAVRVARIHNMCLSICGIHIDIGEGAANPG